MKTVNTPPKKFTVFADGGLRTYEVVGPVRLMPYDEKKGYTAKPDAKSKTFSIKKVTYDKGAPRQDSLADSIGMHGRTWYISI
jgi:hypothetical protein